MNELTACKSLQDIVDYTETSLRKLKVQWDEGRITTREYLLEVRYTADAALHHYTHHNFPIG